MYFKIRYKLNNFVIFYIIFVFFFRVKHFGVIFMIFRVYVKFTLQVFDEMFE
jgi:hypothetical protein